MKLRSYEVMKKGFVHICFIIDESGSMYGSTSDVIGGYKKVIEDQKAVTDGSCAVSIYRFESVPKRDFIGVDINSVSSDLNYSPSGGTAMNDGICLAIDEIGKWLNDMPEEERPEKNMIFIMTDGEENMSRKHTIADVRDRIQHQAEKYSWSFVYMGTDLTSAEYSNSILGGISGCSQTYATRENHMSNYDMISSVTTCYRNLSDSLDTDAKSLSINATIKGFADEMNTLYMSETGINLNIEDDGGTSI